MCASKSEEQVYQKLLELDSWRGDPTMRRRNAMPGTKGKIKALLWFLGITMDEWDDGSTRFDS